MTCPNCERLRDMIRRLLLSADASWETTGAGHDWSEACAEARRVLAARSRAVGLITDHPFQSTDDLEGPQDSVHSKHCQFRLPDALRCAKEETEHATSRREWFHKDHEKSQAGVTLVPRSRAEVDRGSNCERLRESEQGGARMCGCGEVHKASERCGGF